MAAAVSSSTSSRPRSSAARDQISVASSSVSQTPAASAMVILSSVAVEDSAPSNPVTLHCAPRLTVHPR